MISPLVVLLSDFGTNDVYVAVMKGVILSIAPGARLMDLTHGVRAHDVAEGAFLLSAAAPYFPPDTVFLAVVDPGVGTRRKGLIAHAGPWTVVGPDNGLFTFFWLRYPDAEAYELEAPEYQRPTVSATFHGRDVFAPAAAWAARGIRPSRFGSKIESPVKLPIPPPEEGEESIRARVIHVDRFGNLVSNLELEWLEQRRIVIGAGWTLEVGAHTVRRQVATYAEAARGEVVALPGSSGYLEISLSGKSAASELGVDTGAPIQLTRRV